MKETYIAPTCYNQGPPAIITTTLILYFPLKLSKTSEMQHGSRKTITFLSVSKITARWSLHSCMDAAEKHHLYVLNTTVHRFSLQVSLHRYGFSWSLVNFTPKNLLYMCVKRFTSSSHGFSFLSSRISNPKTSKQTLSLPGAWPGLHMR